MLEFGVDPETPGRLLITLAAFCPYMLKFNRPFVGSLNGFMPTPETPAP